MAAEKYGLVSYAAPSKVRTDRGVPGTSPYGFETRQPGKVTNCHEAATNSPQVVAGGAASGVVARLGPLKMCHGSSSSSDLVSLEPWASFATAAGLTAQTGHGFSSLALLGNAAGLNRGRRSLIPGMESISRALDGQGAVPSVARYF